MADSHSSKNLCRARESCGAAGTRSSSFFTSSNGSKATPERDLLFASFVAHAREPIPCLAGGKRRTEELREEDGEEEEEAGDRASPPCELKREKAGAALSIMFDDENEIEELDL